jgi:alpha,alpha-trehalase
MSDWSLIYEGYEPEKERLREALCTLGNGYFATRGASPDSHADDIHYPGTYLAGGYNRLKTNIAGREIENEDLVNLPNWLSLSFRIDDGDWFRIDDVELLSFRQELDVRNGLLLRNLKFRDKEGRTTRWDEQRLVSMADCHLAALSVQLSAEDWSGLLTVRSGLDGNVINDGVERYRSLASRHLETMEMGQPEADAIFLHSRTNQSHIHVALAARTALYRDDHPVEAKRQVETHENEITQTLCCEAKQDDCIRVEKIVAFHTSRDSAISEPGIEVTKTLRRAGRFDALKKAHALAWAHLWDDCNIALREDSDSATADKLRVYIFHLLQTVSPHTIDLDIGVPARGWHGEAYRGHIFWDELFIFPFLNLRLPMLTRALLRYRYRRLPEAREAARKAGYEGAMFPWQSGSDGREESQKLHLNPQSGRWIPDNSHRQRHINSAILQYLAILSSHRRSRVSLFLRRGNAARDRPLLGQHRDLQ